MSPRPEHLSSLSGLGLRWDPEDEALECSTPHALTRAAGYLKHVRGQRGEPVLFRGQTGRWPSCVPALLRGGSPRTRAQRTVALEDSA